MQQTMVFEFVHGVPVPRVPVPGQDAILPDGERFLGLADAAKRAGAEESALAEVYATFFDQFYEPGTDRPRDGAFEHALRATRYAHLNDLEFACLMEAYRSRRLNPWAGHLWVARQWSVELARETVTVMTTVAGLRAIAGGTGLYAGNRRPTYEYGEDQRVPVRARAAVYRLAGGKPRRFEAEAFWDEFYPDAAEGSFCLRMPRLMLGKCAEALALRSAFPEPLGGLYVPEEFGQHGRQRPGGPTPSLPPRPSLAAESPEAAAEQVDQAEDLTPMQFQIRLVEMGYRQERKRMELVAHFRSKYPQLRGEENERRFFSAVLADLRRRGYPEGAGPS